MFVLLMIFSTIFFFEKGHSEKYTVDGGWTSWRTWGPCSGECGFTGKKIRTRECNNPLPSDNGAPCLGPHNEIASCQIAGCTIQKFEKVLSSDLVRMQELNIVKLIHEQAPMLMDMCFSSNCAFSIVKKVLGNEAMIYWNAMNCVKNRVGCPVSGGWSSWEDWSSCSASCGKGEKYRKRVCDNPKPSHPELNCDGISLQVERCIGINCMKLLSGEWSSWSSWSNCSMFCGTGIKFRSRVCKESLEGNNNKRYNKQDTSCEGPSKEIELCEVMNCTVDGEWSSWTGWSLCSSNCGIGTKSRNRMCNNPSPSGSGASCYGPPTEIQACCALPCSVIRHKVAVFYGESTLLYSMRDEPLHMLHIYMRFLPLASFGTLLLRHQSECQKSTCDCVQISLDNARLVFSVKQSECMLFIDSERRLEIGRWHELLVIVTSSYAGLRVNNENYQIRYFPCKSSLMNLDHSMEIGRGFHGEIEKVSINFRPVQLHLLAISSKRENYLVPMKSNFVDYFMGNDEEGFLHLANTESGFVSCPKTNKYWRVIMIIKPKTINGIIATIPSGSLNSYILLFLEEGKVKLLLRQEVIKVFTESAEFAVIDDWLDIVIARNDEKIYLRVNDDKKEYLPPISEKITVICSHHFYIGAVDEDIKEKICPECDIIPQMSFRIGILAINEKQMDLRSIPVKEVTSNQFSSRTISFSDYYEEVRVLLGRGLRLSCFYNRDLNTQETYIGSSKEDIVWILLNKPVTSEKQMDLYTVKSDSRVSSISATSYSSPDIIEGFYTCQIKKFRSESPFYNLHTFGVIMIDENEEFQDIPRKGWFSISIMAFILTTIIASWLIYEGFAHFHSGNGFFSFQNESDYEDDNSELKLFLEDTQVSLNNDETISKENKIRK
ncbi:uncharacterized protein [Prorops nasuta]|uniref:uncharacterized protein n=1 Tax=Prorops nasuta TaxID=863751 RepID=UPI0034CDFB72